MFNSEINELLEAAKSSDEVHKFLTEYIKSHMVAKTATPVEEETPIEELINLEKYTEVEARMNSESWTQCEFDRLCRASIELAKPAFYQLLCQESYKRFVKDSNSVLAASFDRREHIKLALSKKCDLQFCEMMLDEIRPFLGNPETCFEILKDFARCAGEHNRVDVLKLLYKKVGWNSSTSFCATLWHAVKSNNIDVVKWILETFSPITSTNGFHYCPVNIYSMAAGLSDTSILEWLMDRCNFVPSVKYFVDQESPFYNTEIRQKVQGTMAKEIIMFGGTISEKARKLLTGYVNLQEKTETQVV